MNCDVMLSCCEIAVQKSNPLIRFVGFARLLSGGLVAQKNFAVTSTTAMKRVAAARRFRRQCWLAGQ